MKNQSMRPPRTCLFMGCCGGGGALKRNRTCLQHTITPHYSITDRHSHKLLSKCVHSVKKFNLIFKMLINIKSENFEYLK